METNAKQECTHKERHTFATIWLVWIIIANAYTALRLLYSALITNCYPDITVPMQIVTALVTIVSIFFIIQILRWKMIGFTGYVATIVVVLVISLFIGNSSIIRLIYVIAGIAILYGVLQIKKNGKSAWENLE